MLSWSESDYDSDDSDSEEMVGAAEGDGGNHDLAGREERP